MLTATITPDLSEARRLLAKGYHLVPLEPWTKQPPERRAGWNRPENKVKAIDDSATGYGILLASNGLCSLDPDRVDLAPVGLKALGFDHEALMTCGVRTLSTRPNSGGRSAFKAVPGLHWLTFRSEATGTVLECRASSPNLQDVLPGAGYRAKTGELCTQSYANCKRLDDAPDLPPRLREWWLKCSEDVDFLREQQARFFEAIAQHLGKPVKATTALSTGNGKSLAFSAPGYRTAYNAANEVPDILSRHGYTQDDLTGRWAPSTATGKPSVREIRGKDGLWQSDHASDPLQGTFDAWTAHVRLDHGDDVEAAKAAWDAQTLADDFGDLSTDDDEKGVSQIDTLGGKDPMPAITVDEMQAAQLSPRVLVPGLLYADLRNRIAAGGTGKTTLALYEAVLGALARPIWGKQPLQPLRTVLITREDQRGILVARMREIMQALYLTDAETSQVLANVNVLDLTGRHYRVSSVKGDIVVPDGKNLKWLVDVVRPFKPDWLIFDPLVSFGVGENRVNDAEQGIVEAFRVLRNALDCCVEGIHHTGKANSRNGALDQYAGRNGTALPDGCRMVAVLQPLEPAEWRKATGTDLREGESGLVMALPKLSYATAQPDVYIRRRGYLFSHELAQVLTPEQQTSQRWHKVLAYLRDERAQGRNYGKADIEAKHKVMGMTRADVREAIVDLTARGLLVLHGGQGKKGSFYEARTSAELAAEVDDFLKPAGGD
ncbi:MAG TPA: AAA family ATPase [Burkholderiaceae bacterium]|nr:AAA family ATPase [Burkholderiaceae bacterium]